MAKQQKTTTEETQFKAAEGYDIPDFESWEETFDNGFPPYWKPETGKAFYAKPVGVDFTGLWVRIIWEALAPTDCYRGPVDEAEDVLVNPGERFTTSGYTQFKDIDLYLGMPVKVTAVEKLRQQKDPSRHYWRFSGMVSPTDAKKLAAARMQRAREQMTGRVENAPASLES